MFPNFLMQKGLLTVGGKKIGILALQGDFELHKTLLKEMGLWFIEIRKIEELEKIEYLIIPGGESTTFLKFFKEDGWFEPLKKFSEKRKIMGTCAGLILMAEEVENPVQESLKLIPIKVIRNGYGRQINSFIAKIEKHLFGEKPVEGVFIRAPRIKEVKEGVKVLAELNGEAVAVEYKNCIGLTFHPEISKEKIIYEYFLRV